MKKIGTFLLLIVIVVAIALIICYYKEVNDFVNKYWIVVLVIFVLILLFVGVLIHGFWLKRFEQIIDFFKSLLEIVK